ncbi:hypothetical protein [Endozoicomonas sp. G2_2]|nr:hypothetical protein [Endozoicomonas sp. G2_2]
MRRLDSPVHAFNRLAKPLALRRTMPMLASTPGADNNAAMAD